MKRVEFSFDERSLVSLEKLEQQGYQFDVIQLCDRAILVPKNNGFQCAQPQQNPKLGTYVK